MSGNALHGNESTRVYFHLPDFKDHFLYHHLFHDTIQHTPHRCPVVATTYSPHTHTPDPHISCTSISHPHTGISRIPRMPHTSARIVTGTYLVSIGYCIADVSYEAYKLQKRGNVTEKGHPMTTTQVKGLGFSCLPVRCLSFVLAHRWSLTSLTFHNPTFTLTPPHPPTHPPTS